LVDQERALIITKGDGIARKTGLVVVRDCRRGRGASYQFFDQGDEGVKIFFDGQMELVLLLEVDGN